MHESYIYRVLYETWKIMSCKEWNFPIFMVHFSLGSGESNKNSTNIWWTTMNQIKRHFKRKHVKWFLNIFSVPFGWRNFPELLSKMIHSFLRSAEVWQLWLTAAKTLCKNNLAQVRKFEMWYRTVVSSWQNITLMSSWSHSDLKNRPYLVGPKFQNKGKNNVVMGWLNVQHRTD